MVESKNLVMKGMVTSESAPQELSSERSHQIYNLKFVGQFLCHHDRTGSHPMTSWELKCSQVPLSKRLNCSRGRTYKIYIDLIKFYCKKAQKKTDNIHPCKIELNLYSYTIHFILRILDQPSHVIHEFTFLNAQPTFSNKERFYPLYFTWKVNSIRCPFL
jgi:hypothetical protein